MPEYFSFTTPRSSAPKVSVSRPTGGPGGHSQQKRHSGNQSEYLSTTTSIAKASSSSASTSSTSSSLSSLKYDQQEQSSTEWEDLDETRLRQRKHRRRSPSSRSDRHSTAFKSTSKGHPYRRETIRSERVGPQGSTLSLLSDFTSGSSARYSTSSGKTSAHRGYTERDSTRQREHRVRPSHPPSSRYQRIGSGLLSIAGLQTMTTMNPSTLSVLTTGTKSTDRSSGSGSTVTQQTYGRRNSHSSRPSDDVDRQSRQSGSASALAFVDRSDMTPPPAGPTVTEADADDGSDSSSSGSSDIDEASDAGSSDGVDTPSSRSTVPSPTATRNHSKSDRRRKRKPELQQNPAGYVVKRSGSLGSESASGRSSLKAPDVDDIREDDENVASEGSDDVEAATGEAGEGDNGSRGSSTSRSSSQPQYRGFTDQMWRHEEAMRQHLARAQHQQQHYNHHDASLFERGSSPYPYSPQPQGPALAPPDPHTYASFPTPHNQLQHYQWPTHASPLPPQAIHPQVLDHSTAVLQRNDPGSPQGSLPQPSTQLHQQRESAMQQQHNIYQQQPPSSPPPPMAPEAPDLSNRTIEGYEQLALELADPSSPVKPLYRRFAYLHHRILLHLQDELCELEEQLRVLDELIAQSGQQSYFHHHDSGSSASSMLPHHPSTSAAAAADLERENCNSSSPNEAPTFAPPRPRPVSRRAELTHGSETHFQRTQLLGRIFVKSEQYSRAVAAFAALNGGRGAGDHPSSGRSSADPRDVRVYREWMRSHAPLHESETRFLMAEDDLFEPGRSPSTSPSAPDAAAAAGDNHTSKSRQRTREETPSSSSSRQMLLAVALPVTLMLSLLLFALIPSVLGRFVVLAGFALSAWAVVAVASPRFLRELLPDGAGCGSRDWIAGAAGLGLVLGILAVWVP